MVIDWAMHFINALQGVSSLMADATNVVGGGARGTNDLATMAEGNFELPVAYRDLIVTLAIPGLYCLMLVLGRWLKRSHGVRLNWNYHLFALCLAIYFPAKIFDLTLS